MKYISTRGTAPVLGFGEAMMTGLARDGGLYVPDTVPVMSQADIAALAGLPYEEVAFRVMRPYLGGFFGDDEFRGLIDAAYADFGHAARAPLVQLAPNHFLLELFHGPTLAFKDFAMQLIGQMMQAALAKSGERITIVGATSGDTGSAAMEAFRGLANVDVFILFPHGRVSEVQRRQMTTPVEANVHALAMDGDFDDCQARRQGHVQRFRLPRWRAAGRGEQHQLGAGSGAGGLLFLMPPSPWVRRTARSALRCRRATSATSSRATSRAAMGLPIEKLVIATNQNDILDRALRSGDYATDGVKPSISPSMDIQVSSNFERALFDAYGRDGAAVAALMAELKAGGFPYPRARWKPCARPSPRAAVRRMRPPRPSASFADDG